MVKQRRSKISALTPNANETSICGPLMMWRRIYQKRVSSIEGAVANVTTGSIRLFI